MAHAPHRPPPLSSSRLGRRRFRATRQNGTARSRFLTRPTAGGIIDLSAFNGQPDTLALAMLCALIGSSFWVNNASRLGLPVSTSHSIIGALVGVGLAFTGPSSVNWGNAKHGLGAVVLSWVVSPLVASVLGAALFLATKHFVLLAENPHARALALYPAYVTVTFAVVIFFMVLAGANRGASPTHAT